MYSASVTWTTFQVLFFIFGTWQYKLPSALVMWKAEAKLYCKYL